MDAKGSNALVCLSPEQGSLVPVSPFPVAELEAEEPDDFTRLLWLFYQLGFVAFLLLALARRLRLQLVELRLLANYWRTMHQRAVRREQQLKEQLQHLRGQLRELRRRFFGKKSETSSSINTPPHNDDDKNQGKGKKRSRGQQPGSQGHGRRNHDHLPTTDEPCTLPTDQQCCAGCGQPFVEISGTADGDILEIEVRAYRRRYRRQRYRCH